MLWCYLTNQSNIPGAQRSFASTLTKLFEDFSKLQLAYLDLYLIHWPLKLKKGASFPPREEDILPLDLRSTWEALEECVHKGLIKAIGVSNFNVAILKDVMSFAKIPPSVNQVYPMFVLPFSFFLQLLYHYFTCNSSRQYIHNLYLWS